MKKLTRVALIAVIAFVLTLAVSVAGILYAMFTTRGDAERTEALFGAVFFETHSTATGIEATMGVASITAVLGIYLACLIFCFIVGFFIKRLSNYRSTLLQEPSRHTHSEG